MSRAVGHPCESRLHFGSCGPWRRGKAQTHFFLTSWWLQELIGLAFTEDFFVSDLEFEGEHAGHAPILTGIHWHETLDLLSSGGPERPL